MAENQEAPSAVITQGQTTSVGENAEASVQEPIEGVAQEVPAQPSIWSNWLIYAAVGMWVWWLLTNKKRKGQRAQEKKEQERRNNLQKGDRLVTIGRMHGVVVAFTDDTVTIKPDAKSEMTMTFDRQAIFRIQPRPGEEEAAAPEKK